MQCTLPPYNQRIPGQPNDTAKRWTFTLSNTLVSPEGPLFPYTSQDPWLQPLGSLVVRGEGAAFYKDSPSVVLNHEKQNYSLF